MWTTFVFGLIMQNRRPGTLPGSISHILHILLLYFIFLCIFFLFPFFFFHSLSKCCAHQRLQLTGVSAAKVKDMNCHLKKFGHSLGYFISLVNMCFSLLFM